MDKQTKWVGWLGLLLLAGLSAFGCWRQDTLDFGWGALSFVATAAAVAFVYAAIPTEKQELKQ